MDFMKEIWDRSLPNFGYVIEADNGSQYVVVLGGQTVKKGDTRYLREPICRRNEQMQSLYNQDILSDDHKRELAQLMDKIFGICECRQEGIYTREEQATFIEKLSVSEKEQLAHQIKMLKDCRGFYRDYIFRG